MNVPATPRHVLFLCTGNSARSIMAEAILNQLGAGRYLAYSAGSHPTGEVHPLALDILDRNGFLAESAASKSWDLFAEAGAPEMDLVITVCGNAARETCPVWPGAPISVHLGFADPAAAEGSDDEKLVAFAHAFEEIRVRVAGLSTLAVERMDDREFSDAVRRVTQ